MAAVPIVVQRDWKQAAALAYAELVRHRSAGHGAAADAAEEELNAALDEGYAEMRGAGAGDGGA